MAVWTDTVNVMKPTCKTTTRDQMLFCHRQGSILYRYLKFHFIQVFEITLKNLGTMKVFLWRWDSVLARFHLRQVLPYFYLSCMWGWHGYCNSGWMTRVSLVAVADIFLFADAYRLTGTHPAFYLPSEYRWLFPEPWMVWRETVLSSVYRAEVK
jgi:hypothetical protein